MAEDLLSPAPDEVGERAVLRALAARCRGVAQVRFKANRTRLISISRDGRTLYLQEGFRAAPIDVLDAIAQFVAGKRSGPETRAAAARIRAWWASRPHGEIALERDSPEPSANGSPRLRRPIPCCGTDAQRAFLNALYARLNASAFGGRLPGGVRVRLSPRMTRSLGTIRYGRARDGSRSVVEIALQVDLLLPGNERALLDTMLHEMAHAEAYLLHGHRGHGGIWRSIAQRVGCEPRAFARTRLRRRRAGAPPTDHVPRIDRVAVG